MFRSVLRPPSAMSIQKPYKGRHNENLRVPFLQYFIMLKHKINDATVQYLYDLKHVNM